MNYLNNIKRFAGDAVGGIGENIGTGYKAADKQFGGILPGGGAADPVSLVKEVAKDALPGHRVHGEKAAGFVANSGKDAVAGRMDLTTSRTQAGKYSGRFREHLVEEGLEQVGKRIGKKFGVIAAAGPLAPAIAVADTANDIRDGINVVSEIATGQSYDDHISDTFATRDEKLNPLTNLFPSAASKYSSANAYQPDGTPHVMGQGTNENPIVREIKNRAHQARHRFAPQKMDFGISEVMGWN